MNEDGQPLTTEQLLALESSVFSGYVREYIGCDEAWPALLDPMLVQATNRVLTALYMDVAAQFGQRKAALEALQAGRYNQPDRRAEYFTAKSEHDEWRARTLNFQRIVQSRMNDAKAAIADAHRQPAGAGYNPPGQDTQPNPARVKHNSQALYELAYAVWQHQQTSAAAGITPEPHDAELWSKLKSLTSYSAAHGSTPLVEWLERTMSMPGWTSPADRARQRR